MSMDEVLYHTVGFCPETGELNSIRVTLRRTVILRRGTPRYYPTGYTCPLAENCGCPHFNSETDGCPVYTALAEKLR